jgi:serine/threonine protein phosphatase 1
MAGFMASNISITVGDWRPAPQPVSKPLYAVGDVHGDARKLTALVEHLRAHMQPGGTLVYLGDLIDPHPGNTYAHDCAAVVDLVAQPLPNTETVVLAGNHDAFLLIALDAHRNGTRLPWDANHWLAQGGLATGSAWGMFSSTMATPHERLFVAELWSRMTTQQRGVFENMRIWHDHDIYLLVHAGFNPRAQLDRQQARASIIEYPSMRDEQSHPLWMRFNHSTDAAPPGRVLIHGHDSRKQALLGKKRICLDTGVKYSGPLTALEIVGDRMRLIQAGEKVS